MNLWETSETSSIQSRLQGPMQAGPWIQIVLCAVELNVAESCWTNEIHLFRYYSLFGPLGRCGEFARGKGFLEWAFGIARWLCLDGPVRTLLHDIIPSWGWDDQKEILKTVLNFGWVPCVFTLYISTLGPDFVVSNFKEKHSSPERHGTWGLADWSKHCWSFNHSSIAKLYHQKWYHNLA